MRKNLPTKAIRMKEEQRQGPRGGKGLGGSVTKGGQHVGKEGAEGWGQNEGGEASRGSALAGCWQPWEGAEILCCIHCEVTSVFHMGSTPFKDACCCDPETKLRAEECGGGKTSSEVARQSGGQRRRLSQGSGSRSGENGWTQIYFHSHS